MSSEQSPKPRRARSFRGNPDLRSEQSFIFIVIERGAVLMTQRFGQQGRSLFLMERDDGVHAHSAPRRKVARDEDDTGKNPANAE